MATPLPFEPLTPRAAGHATRPRAVSGAGGFEFPPLQVAPEPSPPAPTYGEPELAEATARAREAGRAEAESRLRAEMAASIEQRTSVALEAIARELRAAREGLERSLAARAGASAELAIAMARAIVPRAMEERPLADVEAMLVDLVSRLEGQPRLELALAPDLVASGEALIRRVAGDAGHRGEIVVQADPRLAAGDARLAWGDGGAERDLGASQREVEAVVEAWLPAEPAIEPDHRPLSVAASDQSEETGGE